MLSCVYIISEPCVSTSNNNNASFLYTTFPAVSTVSPNHIEGPELLLG